MWAGESGPSAKKDEPYQEEEKSECGQTKNSQAVGVGRNGAAAVPELAQVLLVVGYITRKDYKGERQRASKEIRLVNIEFGLFVVICS